MPRARSRGDEGEFPSNHPLTFGQSRRKWFSRRNLHEESSIQKSSQTAPASPERRKVSLYRTGPGTQQASRKATPRPSAASTLPHQDSKSVQQSGSQVSHVEVASAEMSNQAAIRDGNNGQRQAKDQQQQTYKKPQSAVAKATAGAKSAAPAEDLAGPASAQRAPRPKSSGPPPPPPPSRKGASTRAQSAEATTGPVPVPPKQAPFGKKLHWIDPSYAQQDANTMFGSSNTVEIDPQLLSEVLATGKEVVSPASRRTSSLREEREIRVFSASRAQNTAILLRKLPISVQRICESSLSDLTARGLRPEDLELLMDKLPSLEERQQILDNAEKTELRDIEREMLPLCRIPAARRRLQFFHTALVHEDQFARLQENIQTVLAAAQEVLDSARLHQLLRTVLKTANYINHGSTQGATAISIRSLSAFATFKFGSEASALHYLCRTLCSAEFLSALQADLKHLSRAAKQNPALQQQELSEFRSLAQLVDEMKAEALGSNSTSTAQVGAADAAAGGSAVTRPFEELSLSLHRELDELETSAERSKLVVEQAQRFLGESKKLASSEEFFAHIAGFLDLLVATSREMNRSRARSASASLPERPCGKGARSVSASFPTDVAPSP